MPPDEEVDFILDKPFLFAITSETGLPLFMGVVQNPA
jgi:serine protease inhibitor